MQSTEKKLEKAYPFTAPSSRRPREYIAMTLEGAATLMLATIRHRQGNSEMFLDASESFDNSIDPDLEDWFTFLFPVPQKFP